MLPETLFFYWLTCTISRVLANGKIYVTLKYAL